MNKKEVDIRTINFNKVDDFRILLLLSDKNVTSLAKEYVLRKYLKRIKKMEYQYLSLLLLEMNAEIIDVCNDLVKSIIEDLSYQDVEALVYADKSYTNVSKTIVNLLKYDWFSKDPKYLMIKEANDLEKNKEKVLSAAKITRVGNKIIGELASDHNFELMDKIFSNYLYIIEKNDFEYFYDFREKGYKYIDNFIKKDKDITKNMLIFDAYMLKSQNIDKYQIDLEFYENDKDSKYATHTNSVLKINLACLSKVNNIEGDRKFAIEYLFYAISKEFKGAYYQYYLKMPVAKRDDLIEELKMHNITLSWALKRCCKKREHMSHFTHEYCLNVDALKEVYKRYTLLKSISDQDKYKFNTYIAKILVKAFKSIDRKNSYSSSPVEYVTKELKKYKLDDNLKSCLLDGESELSTSLELVKKNLTDIEKFELGYKCNYLDTLVSISESTVQVTNIFWE